MFFFVVFLWLLTFVLQDGRAINVFAGFWPTIVENGKCLFNFSSGRNYMAAI